MAAKKPEKPASKRQEQAGRNQREGSSNSGTANRMGIGKRTAERHRQTYNDKKGNKK